MTRPVISVGADGDEGVAGTASPTLEVERRQRKDLVGVVDPPSGDR